MMEVTFSMSRRSAGSPARHGPSRDKLCCNLPSTMIPLGELHADSTNVLNLLVKQNILENRR